MEGLIFFIPTLICWVVFFRFFSKDRSRYRNCYLLWIAIMSTIPFIVSRAGERSSTIGFALIITIGIVLLIVPFFLIYNGIVMIKREGRSKAHLLSLALGIVILIGEIATFASVIMYSFSYDPGEFRSEVFIGIMLSVTVIYGSMAFLIFMIYVVFLQIIPRKKDFDYIIIHGAGLIDGERVSKLLQDRLDKAIEVYRKDPSPTKMIPSGGRGSDEKLSEAEAMKNYLMEKGIPESDIITEDRSTTTFENLLFSKEIIDSREGRKYTALVTSNYHVYRALRYCKKIGLECAGIGSHVAFYYWPTALIREFIAIHAEKKHAVIFFGGWLIMMALILAIYFNIIK